MHAESATASNIQMLMQLKHSPSTTNTTPRHTTHTEHNILAKGNSKASRIKDAVTSEAMNSKGNHTYTANMQAWNNCKQMDEQRAKCNTQKHRNTMATKHRQEHE